MLPLSLLKAAVGHQILVELKNGQTVNGILVSCDSWMNILLKQVINTSANGVQCWKMTECFIRGNTVRYFRVPNEVLDIALKADAEKSLQYAQRNTQTRSTRPNQRNDRPNDNQNQQQKGNNQKSNRRFNNNNQNNNRRNNNKNRSKNQKSNRSGQKSGGKQQRTD